MGFQTVPGGLHFPQRMSQSTIFRAGIVLDAADEKLAFIFNIGKTGTISKVGFSTAIVTTGATMDVRLETVSLTNGDPTGTLLGTNSNGSQVILDADDNVWFSTSLTTPVAVTRGDLVAVVIVNPVASPGNLEIAATRWDRNRFPYSDLFTAAWAKESDSNGPNCALEYNDGTYAVQPGVYPNQAITVRIFNNTDTPDEVGMIFQFPFPVQATGAWVNVDLDGDVDIVLYDSDGTTVLESKSFDTDVRQATTEGSLKFFFDNPVELTKNTNYRLALKPTSATDIRLRDFTVDAAAIMDSWEGGQKFHMTERTDAGAWTETTTRRPVMGLLLDGFDDGVGGAETQQGTTQISLVI